MQDELILALDQDDDEYMAVSDIYMMLNTVNTFEVDVIRDPAGYLKNKGKAISQPVVATYE